MANANDARAESFKELDKVIAQWKDEPGGLLPIMQAAQEKIGCVDEEVQNYISKAVNVPVTTIYGIATFYSLFSLEPKGKHVINVCLGTACYVRGAQKVMDKMEAELGVEAGHTTPDGLFTLAAMRCIGCCGLAPAMMIGDDVYGKCTPEKIPGILAKYRA